ncbi:MAG: leucine-rich repeat domain-containing protein [Bacteroidales bacterium]|nr:leucine-rich repeat domain-containing protein [Bacteroidales bacterium]
MSLSTSSSSTPFSGCPIESLYLGRDLSYYFYYSPFKNNTKMTKLTIGNSVTSIGRYAFQGCSGLTSVNIPNSVTYIGSSAFEGCSGLTSVNIPNSVTTIGESAFRDCSGLTSVNIPNSVTSIAVKAFSGCSGLTSLTIPNSVTSIGNSAFAYCSGLTSVNTPNSVISIGDYAFSGCSGLTSVDIPESVTSIGIFAFYGCSGLKELHISDLEAWCNIRFSTLFSNPLYYSHHLYVNDTEIKELVIPNSVTSIGSYAFSGCSGLTSLTIPNSVTSIDEEAFHSCSGLTSLTIPNSVTVIGGYAFNDCSGLTSVTIGNNVTSIGVSAFSGCSELTELLFPNSVKYLGFNVCDGCVKLQKLILGDGIQKIGDSNNTRFNGLPSLKEVRIGSEIKYIGKSFANCPKLEDVYCYAVRYPETTSDAFEGSYIDYAILHVPAEGVEPYSKQVPWSGFRRIIAIEAPNPSDYTLSDAGFATYYEKYYDTALPTGVKASVVTGASDSKLTYKVIANGDEGGIVPAGTAVLLQGKERRAASYTLTPKESTTHYTGENLLHGSDDATTTTADGDCLFYKLAYGPKGTEWSNVLGWFWGDADGKPFNIEGHKAWLAIPKSAAVKSRPLFYSIDGNAIELEDLSLIHSQGEDISESELYDLQGRRLNVSAGETPALPGVYIRNGQKVLIK